MSGHSKWSTIKRKKGAADAQRGRLFSRLAREITIAAKLGGPSIEGNARLRLAVQNAKSDNLPKENIARAIKKATGAGEENYQEVLYEGYAPHGIAVYVEALTDNLNRTIAQIRYLFTKHGGRMSKPGTLDFLFERVGCFLLKRSPEWGDEMVLRLIDAGSSEIEDLGEDGIGVTCPFEQFGAMQKAVEELGLDIIQADLRRLPQDPISLSSTEAQQVIKFLNLFEEDDDVQRVFHNMKT
ncbi:MAG: YebC/PmpR family DNA-binding transcriptional regulator [Cytophagales bacterium]|nr:YebC/PmpR family DNA-binding transcriptional regulator [Cytophagales bacterium]